MEFLIRFTQSHESFRLPEIEALAELHNIDLQVIEYHLASPFCIVRLSSAEAARTLVQRSILAQSIHELWGTGATLSALHDSVRAKTSYLWTQYLQPSFKFTVDSFQGTRTPAAKLAMINSFAYLGFQGPIVMTSPDEEFTVFEDWPPNSMPLGITDPVILHLGRFVSSSARDLIMKFDLKKRGYISTTSMDSELALITANIALAAEGRLIYDPFVGTGSFPVACAQFGAMGWGSDIDGRSIRGSGGKKSLRGNFEQYGLKSLLGDMFSADLTNTPIRVPSKKRLFDAIVCDPPYGVREGLRVLGLRDPEKTPWLIEEGIRNWKYVRSAIMYRHGILTRAGPQTTSPQRSHTASSPCSTISSLSPRRRSLTTAAFRFGCPVPTTRSRSCQSRTTPASNR